MHIFVSLTAYIFLQLTVHFLMSVSVSEILFTYITLTLFKKHGKPILYDYWFNSSSETFKLTFKSYLADAKLAS